MINVNQITAELAKMPDQALQQYAAMHKNDPYTVALALSESNRRKQMRMGAQGAGAMPQPKVVDQDIAQMASPPQQQPLPEESGIGQLPAQNMQNMAGGGIVAFDEGGDVPGYAEGVFTGPGTSADYRAYALDKAAKMGLNPSLVDRIFKIESGYDPYARSGSGSTGVGQLIKSTASAYGLKVPPKNVKTTDPTKDERLNPIMNIDASLAYMADLNKKYKGDPQLVAVAYNQGEPTLDAHLRKNGGKLVPENLQQEIAAKLKADGKLTDAQIAARAVEPVNYLNKLNTTALPVQSGLSAGESVVQPPPPVDRSVPTGYKAEQAAQQADYDAQVRALQNESFLDKSKRVGRGLLGMGEAGLSTLGSITTYPTSAIAAAAQNPKGAKDAAQGLFTPEAAAYHKLVGELRDQATYSPRTTEGQEQLDTVNKALSGLPPYIGQIGPFKSSTNLLPKAIPKAVPKAGIPALVESPAAKAVKPVAPEAKTPGVWEQLPLFPELETAPSAAPASAYPAGVMSGKTPFAQGAQMELPFNQPEGLPPKSTNVRPTPVQGELFPETTAGKEYPIDPEAAGIAAVQRARLAKERAAAETQAAETTKPVEEMPSAMTPEEMLDRARNYELDQQKATIIRNRQTLREAGLPGLANPVNATSPATKETTQALNTTANAYPSGIMGGAPQAETEEAGLESLLPTAEAPKKGGTDWNDLMLKLGLNLMASKDPNAISGVGQAGLATLGMQQAEEKAKSEAAYREAMAKHATMPSSEIQTLEWARDPNNMKLLRQIAQAKADPKASAQEALAFLKDAGVVLKETDPVLYGVLRNKVLGGNAPGSYLDTAPKGATIY